MSATNRGTVRNDADFYRTPEDVTEKILIELHRGIFEDANILEPCAGDGAIVKVISKYRPFSTITAIEPRKEEEENLKNSGADAVDCGYDFREMVWPEKKFDTVITNPPYSIAQEIIEHCFYVAPDAEIIMLLRLGFLESQKREEFWQKHPLTQLYPLLKRPSFTGRGTDATAYGWFVWSKYRKPLIKSI